MDFHKAISVENSESDIYLKTLIFMSTVVNLYILSPSVADRMQIWLVLKEKHESTALISNRPIKKFTDLQASCGTQCNKILLHPFWLTIKSICTNRKT